MSSGQGPPERNDPEREARAQAVLDQARDAIISIDRQGLITDFNRAAEVMFGYRADEVFGKNVELLMPSPYREEHSGYLRSYEETGDRKAIGKIRDVAGQRKNGEIFPIELSVAEVALESGRVYSAVIRDVSELRAATAALEEVNTFNERLIDTAPVVVLVTDEQGYIQQFNRYMERLCGYSSEVLRGRRFVDVFVEEAELATADGLFGPTLDEQGVVEHQTPIFAKSGRRLLVQWYGRALRDSQEGNYGVLFVGVDVTERLERERKMAELQRLANERQRLAELGAISAEIVHDLGNPLSGISMQADRLLRRIERALPPEQAEKVEQPARRILDAVERLKRLVRGIMEFARDQRLALAEVDICGLLRTVTALWAPVAEEAGVKLVLHGPDRMVVRADADKMTRALDNLVKNAVEAHEGGPGEVVVSVSLDDTGMVAITVADSGVGMPEDLDPFRLFSTSKTGGSGIGLAVSQQIVTAHGGTVAYAPRDVCGTEFRVVFPAAGPPGAS